MISNVYVYRHIIEKFETRKESTLATLGSSPNIHIFKSVKLYHLHSIWQNYSEMRMRKIKFLSQAEISENIYVKIRIDGIYALIHIGNNRVL